MKFYFLLEVLLVYHTRAHSDHSDQGESIGNVLNDNESIELNDDNFEHLTQASTGATTGDWFIYFYDPSSVSFNDFTETWLNLYRKVSENNDFTVNIAKVNVKNSPDVSKRFQIGATPRLLYIRLGKIYEIEFLTNEEFLFDIVKEKQYQKYPSKAVPRPIGSLSDLSLPTLFSLPIYVHAVWIFPLIVAIVYLRPSKSKQS